MKSTKRSLALSTLSLILCIAMLLGTTFAWFTDSVTSGKNRILAGNLDVEMYFKGAKDASKEIPADTDWKTVQSEPDVDPHFFTDAQGNEIKWEPGVMSFAQFRIANVGTLALKYKFITRATFNKILDDEGHNLSQVIKVAVLAGTQVPTRDSIQSITNWSTFDSFAGEGSIQPGETGNTNDCTVVLYWEPGENDDLWNVNNGKQVNDHFTDEMGEEALWLDIDIQLRATQLQSEEDSFDNTYDDLSTFPSIAGKIDALGSGESNRSMDENDGKTQEDVIVKIIKIDTSGGEIGDVSVKKESVDQVLDEMFGEMGTEENAQEVTDELKLNVKVTTKNSSTDSIKLDISMFADAVRTIKASDGTVSTQSQTNVSITELHDPVVIPLTLEPQLLNVQVTHSHINDDGSETVTEMEEVASESEVTTGKFFYDEVTGKLYVETDKFSEFDIKYERIAVAAVNGDTYTTLSMAVEKAEEGDTVEVLKETDIPAVISKPGITINMNGVAASNVEIPEGTTTTLTGEGIFYAEVAGDLCLVGGKYEDIQFKGNGNIELVDVETDKLATLEGSNMSITVKGKSKIKDTAFGGTALLTVESGEFEKVTALDPEKVKISIVAGKFHLEEAGEKEAFELFLTDTQYLVETTDSGWFSAETFGDNIVARIGNTGYTGLAGAIDTVKGGQTVKMVKNVSKTIPSAGGCDLECPFNPEKSGNRTFDLNGKTVVLDMGGWNFNVGSVIYLAYSWSGVYNGTFTFKDSKGGGKLVASKTDPSSRVVAVSNDTHSFYNFVFESGTYQGTTAGVYFQAGNVTVNGGTFVGPIAFEYNADDYTGTKFGDVVINGGTFDGRFVIANFAGTSTDFAAKINSVTVNGGKFKTNEAQPFLGEGKILVEEDGWYVVKDASDAPTSYAARVDNYYFVNPGEGNDALKYAKKINNAVVELKEATTEALTINESESITILGDTSLYVAPVATAGFTLKTEEVDGGFRYYVPEIAPYKVGTTEYTDWTSAFKAANYATPLELQKDVTNTSTVSSTGSRIKIDLKGHTLTLNNAQIQTSNQSGGQSEIVNGTIVSNGGKAIWQVWNKKGFVLNNVNIVTTGAVLSDTAQSDASHKITNCNIECGALSLSGSASTTALSNSTINCSGSISTNATITGTNSITGSSVTLYGSVGGNTTVKGTTSVIIQTNATVASTVSVEAPKITISNTAGINAGNYKADKFVFGASNKVITVSGGTFDGELSLATSSGAGLVVTGGKFTSNPTAYLADGYTANLVEGYYVVSAN